MAGWGVCWFLLAATRGYATPVELALGEGIALVEPPPAEGAPALTARAAVLMEWTTGNVLYALRATEKRDPASLTKIMTAILALERGSLPEPVKISAHAAWMPGSTMDLREGEEYPLRDLLCGLLLESGNDAAVAIAEHLAGSEESFARLMTEKARQLGALSTRFRNPHGLTEPGHYTTAYDLALITRYAMGLPLFAELVGTKEREVRELNDPSGGRALRNTNRLLWSYPGAEGVKTGTTSAAGPCLVTSATREGMRLLCVVLDAADRWGDTVRLLDWGFERFTLVHRGYAGQLYGQIPVGGGATPRVDLVLARDLVAVVRKEELGRIQLREEAARQVRAPVRKGQPLGKIFLVAGERQAAEALLVARDSVPRATPFWWFWRLFAPALRLLDGWDLAFLPGARLLC